MSKQKSNESQVAEMTKKREAINQVSPSFCLAKWLQSTVYLHTGMTHSCHHPSPHKIPLSEIEVDPSALHNTKFKQEIRREMLAGAYPKECQYCWNVEKLKGNHFSDRHYKSTDPWAYPHLERVKNNQEKPLAPTYLEVAFESTCNFKCAYCSPSLSSKWMEESKKHGPYPTASKTGDIEWLKSTGSFPIAKSEDNPYIEAFWKWWPEISQQLHTFRITGGEPLLSQNTWKTLDSLCQQEHPNLNLAINTNMGISDLLVDRLIEKYNSVSPKVKDFTIYTSCEAHGVQAEYIRFGLNYSQFFRNIEKFLTKTPEDSRVHLMITFNALSVPSFLNFLDDVLKLRRQFNKTDALNRIPMMINYLHWPHFMSAQVLPTDLKRHWASKYLEFIKRPPKTDHPGRFYLEEIDQVERLCKHIQNKPNNLENSRKDFGLFFSEYDRRRKTNFSETFPELSDFYHDCLSR